MLEKREGTWRSACSHPVLDVTRAGLEQGSWQHASCWSIYENSHKERRWVFVSLPAGLVLFLWNRSWLPVEEIPFRKTLWKQKPSLPNPQGGVASAQLCYTLSSWALRLLLSAGAGGFDAPALPPCSPPHGWKGPCPLFQLSSSGDPAPHGGTTAEGQ